MMKTSRIRERGYRPVRTALYETTLPVWGGTPQTPYVSFTAHAPGGCEYQVMSDVVTESFAKRSGNGELIFNPMEKVARGQSGSGKGYKIRVLTGSSAGTVYQAEGNWPLYLGLRTFNYVPVPEVEWLPKFPPDASNALERGIAVACTQAKRTPSDAHLLVAMAEYRLTLGLIPGLLKGWRDLFRRINAREESFSRKRFASRPVDALRNLRDLEHVLNDTWLAMRFGARPLVMDTLGVLKALRKTRSDEIIRDTSRGKAEWSTTQRLTAVNSFGMLRTPMSMQNEDHFTVRAMSIWEAKMTAMDDLGLGLSHVPEAVIDLTRFSFVLNWIVNLNDYFSALGAAANPKWADKGGVYVVRRESSTILSVEPGSTSADPNYALDRAVEGVSLTVTRSSRRVVGLKPPALVLRPNPFDWMSDFRILDAVALTRQQTRGKGVTLLASFERKLYGKKL